MVTAESAALFKASFSLNPELAYSSMGDRTD
jgi:hypothetical protein